MGLTLSICSPGRRFLDARPVRDVTLPGVEGQIQVLADHAHMVGTLETGILSYHLEDGTHEFAAVSTGFFEVAKGHVMVLAETLEVMDEIDLERARRAAMNAETKLNQAQLEPDLIRKYQLKYERAQIRQQVGSKSSESAH
ncbi:MAG: ATP synthase F1 subunit epsilon [Bdellovibrionales bacterium]|nr:ATP synthase F1 subunit epsilon [Bdellovibrionales bacterium]